MKKFTVEGRGEFPKDMLRYDDCVAATMADQASIDQDYPHVGNHKRRVELMTSNSYAPHIHRWDSFGWTVVATDSKPEYMMAAERAAVAGIKAPSHVEHAESKDDHFVVNELPLTDGSNVYDVVGFAGNTRVTFHAVNERHAHHICKALNQGMSGFAVDTLRE